MNVLRTPPLCEHCGKPCKAIVRNADGVFCSVKHRNLAIAAREKAIAVIEPEPEPTLPVVYKPLDLSDEQTIIETWLEARSEKTRVCYREWMGNFATWFASTGHRRPQSTTDAQAILDLVSLGPARANLLVQRWINEQVKIGLSRATYAKKYAAVRSFTRALCRAGACSFVIEAQLPRHEPPSAMARAKKWARLPEAYARLVAHLAALASREDAKPADVRDWAFVRTARDLGFRRIELQRMDLDDADFEANTVLVLGKGRRAKEEMPMPSSLVPVLKAWIRVRAELEPTSPAMFVSLRGGSRLDEKTFNAIVTARVREAGVRLRPHDLRRIFSTRSIQDHGLNDAKALTRHRNVSTLEIYDISQGANLAAMAETVTRDQPLIDPTKARKSSTRRK